MNSEKSPISISKFILIFISTLLACSLFISYQWNYCETVKNPPTFPIYPQSALTEVTQTVETIRYQIATYDYTSKDSPRLILEFYEQLYGCRLFSESTVLCTDVGALPYGNYRVVIRSATENNDDALTPFFVEVNWTNCATYWR